MKIKVCGLFDHNNLTQVLKLQPDFIGLNFYEHSKRFCTFKEVPKIDLGISQLVGVFVNSSIDYIKEKVELFKLSMIQLHGTETIAEVETIKNKLPQCKIVKAFGVDETADLVALADWTDLVDYFLFDKKAVSFGGSGKKFDWDILRLSPPGKSFFLAGGIGPEDSRALRVLGNVEPSLVAIDINSRFEDRNGLKDVASIEKFMKEIRL